MTHSFFSGRMVWVYLGMLLLVFGVNDANRLAGAFRPSFGQQRPTEIVWTHRNGAKLQIQAASGNLCRNIAARPSTTTSTTLSCGLLEAIQNAFGNDTTTTTTTTTTKATASHILLQEKTPQSKQTLVNLKAEIQDDPIQFGEAAAKYSDCSSASQGGDLGEFGRGTMAKEFEKVVFDPQTPIGVVQGPITTEFGYHLILVKERS